MEEVKPLLQDEEEKFYFLENKPNNKIGNFSKEKVTTIVLSVIVLWLTWYSFYPFYIGFKYYDEAHPSEQLPS